MGFSKMRDPTNAKSLHLKPLRLLIPQTLLEACASTPPSYGGSWVFISGVLSPLGRVISIVTLLITPKP